MGGSSSKRAGSDGHRSLFAAVLLGLAVLAAMPREGHARLEDWRSHGVLLERNLTEREVGALARSIPNGGGEGRRMVAGLAGRLGVEDTALDNFLAILAEGKVRDGQFASCLADIVVRHEELVRRLAKPDPVPGPAEAALVRDARTAVEAGDYAQADSLLARAGEVAMGAGGDAAGGRSLSAAAWRAGRGMLSLMRLKHLEAADHFGAAAGLVPANAPLVRADYLARQAHALVAQGTGRGDTDALVQAVAALESALPGFPREGVPLQWAATQSDLAYVLAVLGGDERDPGILERAIAAYRAAMEVQTRDRTPVERALALRELGGTLSDLGNMERSADRMEEAVAVLREALEEHRGDDMTLYRAMGRGTLGIALAGLGMQTKDTAHLREAIEVLRAAADPELRKHMPLIWATTQHNRGNVVSGLMDMVGQDPVLLEQAAEAYRAALQERTRERAPHEWALTQRNLAQALYELDVWKRDATLLEEAVAVWRVLMEEETPDYDPLGWAHNQANRGNALQRLGRRKPDPALLEEAAGAYRSALDVFEALREERFVSMVSRNLDLARAALAALRRDPGRPLPE